MSHIEPERLIILGVLIVLFVLLIHWTVSQILKARAKEFPVLVRAEAPTIAPTFLPDPDGEHFVLDETTSLPDRWVLRGSIVLDGQVSVRNIRFHVPKNVIQFKLVYVHGWKLVDPNTGTHYAANTESVAIVDPT